jgi:NADH dehydrogenase FAD-containing subunit
MAKATKTKATSTTKNAAPAASGSGYSVVTEFRDIHDFNKVYAVGDNVSHLDKARLDSLVSLGYVTANEVSGDDSQTGEE